MTVVAATVPYPWPYDEVLAPSRLALVVAGAQVGWVARSKRVADVVPVVMRVAAELREVGALVVAVRHGAVFGRRPCPLPPVPGEDDWWLVFHSRCADVVVDAGGVDGFCGGRLDEVLRGRGVDHLVLAGFGHEAAVDSTLRSANDRGYECLVLADGVAPLDPGLSAHALASVTMSGGIFGAVGTSTALVSAIRRRVPVEARP